jgi:hypothetical protein
MVRRTSEVLSPAGTASVCTRAPGGSSARANPAPITRPHHTAVSKRRDADGNRDFMARSGVDSQSGRNLAADSPPATGAPSPRSAPGHHPSPDSHSLPACGYRSGRRPPPPASSGGASRFPPRRANRRTGNFPGRKLSGLPSGQQPPCEARLTLRQGDHAQLATQILDQVFDPAGGHEFLRALAVAIDLERV